jgi:hypothetical protein
MLNGQDQAHLVGERTAAAGAIRGELRLVQLDQVLGLAAGTVNWLVNVLGRSDLEAGEQWPELVHPFAAAIDTELPKAPSSVHLLLRDKASWVEP